MKKIIIFFVIIFISQLSLARGYSTHHYHYPHYSHYRNNYSYRSGGTHWVRTYRKRNGTIVQGHLSGNPGSGIHCHNNICR